MSWEFVKQIRDWLGLGGLMLAALMAVGFSVNPPWASAESVKNIQTQITEIIIRSEKTDVLSLKTQRIVLQIQLREAKKDLQENPNSRSAQILVQQIEDQLAEIDRALGKPH